MVISEQHRRAETEDCRRLAEKVVFISMK